MTGSPPMRPGAPEMTPEMAGAGGPTSPPSPGVRAAYALTLALIAVYIVLDVVAQLLPPHYSPIRQAESDLAVGPYGYIMTINFVVRGLLSSAFLYGLWHGSGLRTRTRAGFVLVGVWAVGAFVLAAFPTDVPATPVSGHGFVHLVTAIVAFLAAAVGEILLSTHFAQDRTLARIRSPALGIAVLALLFALFDFASGAVVPHLGGLIERIFLGLVLLWILVVAAYSLRSAERFARTPSGTAAAP